MKPGLAILVFIGLITVLNAAFIVDQREQVLVLQFGKEQRVVKDPGLYFKIPFIQDLVRYDKRLLDLDAKPSEVIDSKEKPLIVDAFVKFLIADPLLFYQKVQAEDIARQRLNTFLDSRLRKVMGSVSIKTLLTNERGDVMQRISTDVAEQAEALGIKVVDVRIMRADFPEENSNKIFENMKNEREKEAKELRAQGAEQAQKIQAEADKERTVLLAEAEKEAQLLRGQGDAQATAIYAKAFKKDRKFFEFYRSLQAYKKALKKGDTTLVISPDSDFLKFMDDANGNQQR